MAAFAPAGVVPAGRSRTAVFGSRIGVGTVVSVGLHAAIFGVFIVMLLRGLIREDVDTTPQVSVVDFEVPPEPPPRPRTPPPPPPRPPPEPALEPHPAARAIPHAAPHAAPAVMAGAGHGGAGGDEMATGTASDWHGNTPPAPEPPHDIPPPPPAVHHPPPPPPAPHEVSDEELSVHPNIRCSSSRIAALYPQAAIDNDAEADVAVEVIVDATGHVLRATARSDPGFGLGAASEQALLTACRPTAIPLDRAGNPVITRVIHTMHWQLE